MNLMPKPKSTIQHNPLDGLDSAPQPDLASTETAAEATAPAVEAAAESASSHTETLEPITAQATVADLTPDSSGPTRRRRAQRTVYRYMAFSGVAGLVPLPAVDVATVTGVQVKMLHALSRLYDVPFNAGLARQIVLALIGGGGSVVLAMPAASAAKAVPVVGTAASFVLSPTFATASCYAVGRAFISHFEAGGTLETFDTSHVQTEAQPAAA
jgi:uncharacterized protein (DUF697 family)